MLAQQSHLIIIYLRVRPSHRIWLSTGQFRPFFFFVFNIFRPRHLSWTFLRSVKIIFCLIIGCCCLLIQRTLFFLHLFENFWRQSYRRFLNKDVLVHWCSDWDLSKGRKCNYSFPFCEIEHQLKLLPRLSMMTFTAERVFLAMKMNKLTPRNSLIRKEMMAASLNSLSRTHKLFSFSIQTFCRMYLQFGSSPLWRSCPHQEGSSSYVPFSVISKSITCLSFWPL